MAETVAPVHFMTPQLIKREKDRSCTASKLTMNQELLTKFYCEEGKNLRQISEVLNVDPETVRRWMKKLGIPRRNHSQAQSLRMKLKVTPHDLYRLYWVERKSLNRIARDFGVTGSIVRRQMKRFNSVGGKSPFFRDGMRVKKYLSRHAKNMWRGE